MRLWRSRYAFEGAVMRIHLRVRTMRKSEESSFSVLLSRSDTHLTQGIVRCLAAVQP